MINYARPEDPLFVEPVATPLTEEKVAFYLSKFWEKIIGTKITKEQLGCLWAHTVLENGRAIKYSYNYNVGNIKKINGLKYTSYKCNEIINGKSQWFEPYHPQTLFVAWDTPEEGFEFYLKFLQKERYAKALEALKAGDPEQYSHWLKKGGYYTASEHFYTLAISKLYKEFMAKADKLMNYVPDEENKIEQKIDVIIPPRDHSVPEITIPKLTEVKLDQKLKWWEILIGFILKFLKIK